MKNKKFLIINGPNLNMLGSREVSIYGHLTLEQIKQNTEDHFQGQNIEIEWFQSNIEGEIVTKIQSLVGKNEFAALVINPGAYSHTSVAILDAYMLLKIPVIEVHLSNTSSREEFRRMKLTGSAAQAIIEGLGPKAYILGIYSQLI